MPTIQKTSSFTPGLPLLWRAFGAVGVRLLGACIIVLVGECISRGGGHAGLAWVVADSVAYLLSVLYVLLCVAGLEAFLSLRLTLGLLGGLFWVFSIADEVKIQKLGQPATPSDLLLSRQYLEVGYMLWGRWAYVFFGIAGLACAALLAWMIRRYRTNGTFIERLSMFALRFGCLVIAVALVVLPDFNYRTARFRHSPIAEQLDRWNVSNLNFDPASNVKTNGQLISFLMNMRSALVHPPRGYSEQSVSAALAGPSFRAKAVLPNDGHEGAVEVVVIMSEALWDPSALPGVTYSDPLFAGANYRARATMFSPVFGGYTANTEFEFLTRVSNGILPVGSIPYVQYVSHPMESLALDFRRAGYRSVALHPFDGNFWNRKNVYRDLGFQVFRDKDQFVHRDMTGPFINDHSLANEIISMSEETTGPHFIFAVSLQGHAPYTGGMYRYSNRVEVDDPHHLLSEDAHDQLRTYASGVRDAIHGFNEVVAHYQQTGRRAIVVMFGDHLPSLGDGYLVYRQTGFLKSANQDQWTAQDQRNMHGVPLLIWSNLPVAPVLSNKEFSPVYLGTFIKHYAGLPDTALDRVLTRASASYPVLSQFFSQSADQEVVRGMPSDSAAVSNYEFIAYDLLLGKGYAEKTLGRTVAP